MNEDLFFTCIYSIVKNIQTQRNITRMLIAVTLKVRTPSSLQVK